MFANTPKEKVLGAALDMLFTHVYSLTKSQSESIDDKMKTLEWLQRSIPELRRLMIAVKTEQVNK